MFRKKQNWIDKVSRSYVTVSTKSHQTYRGVLMENFDDGILLVSPAVIQDGGKQVQLGGDLFIPREQIMVIQRDITGAHGLKPVEAP